MLDRRIRFKIKTYKLVIPLPYKNTETSIALLCIRKKGKRERNLFKKIKKES